MRCATEDKGARGLGRERLAKATLYTSAEPCAMCAAATYWSGVSLVVYALSEEKVLSLTGKHLDNHARSLPMEAEIGRRAQRGVPGMTPGDTGAIPGYRRAFGR
jgi:tRNA(Arg) A34 adenosine deaminase TadA